MATIIPFAGQVDDAERQQWIGSINACAQRFSLVPIKDVTDKHTAEVAVVANPQASELNDLPNLKWLQSLWAGVDSLLDSPLHPEIEIVRLTDPQMAETMSEAVLAWSLYLHRKMPEYHKLQRNSEWRVLTHTLPAHCSISVFGLGKLGLRAAHRLQQNGFAVRGWSNSHKSIDNITTFYGEEGLKEVLPLTDIAVILLPHTEDTEALFGSTTLQQLPKGAAIINFARGPIVVEKDLLEYLDNGHIDHAVLDVFNQEPLDASHPFWRHPDVTVLPHISAPTTIETASKIAAGNIDNYLQNGVMPASVSRTKGY